MEDRSIDGVSRRACAARCGFVHWDNPVPIVGVLVQWGDRFVLARNATWPTGVFSVISGFLERGESPETAVARETKEELGLDVDSREFIGHHVVPEPNLLMIAFAVRASGALVISDEIAETQLVSFDQLRDFDFGRLTLTQQLVRDWTVRAARRPPTA
jgi:NADH pyrophosphatase NudC (nudix superfamily)